MGEMIKNFRDLKIWQKGIDIVEDVYKITRAFPKEEIYGLTSQMRRCAVSIPSNIAEGFKRYHSKEYKQFLYVTLGSSAELETQLVISQKIRYINERQAEGILEKINHLSRMITVLMRKLI